MCTPRLGSRAWPRALVVIAMLGSRAAAGPAENVARADRLFTEARALLDSGRADEACPKLEESQRLDPGRGTLINLAACYEATNRPLLAHEQYLEVERQSIAAKDTDRATAARARIHAIELTIARLSITVAESAPGLEIELDGKRVPEVRWTGILRMPGTVRVRAWAPDRVPHEATFVATAGRETVIGVPALATIANPTPATHARRRRLVIAGVVGGAGLVALGASIAIAFDARSTYDDVIDRECEGDHRTCTPTGFEAANDARSRGTIATVVGGVGLAAIATAGVLWWTAPRERPTTVTRLVPVVSGDAIGVSIGGGF